LEITRLHYSKKENPFLFCWETNKKFNMKNFLKPAALLLFLSVSLCGAGQMAIVEYMKVKPGNDSNYLEVEKAWKKLHEVRLKTGQILSWALYEPMFTGQDFEYQYVTVTVYKDLAGYEKAVWSDSLSQMAYPDYKEKDWQEFGKKTGDARVLSQVQVYRLVTEANAKAMKPVKYLQLSNMAVKPGGEGAYEKLENDYFKPLHEAAIKAGQMEGWSIWSKYPGNYTQSKYTAVNEFSSLAQIDGIDYGKLFKKVFPYKSEDELITKTGNARTIVESAIWRRIDLVGGN
jgi:hypothetical protein